MSRSILLVPSTLKGNGSGHLVRALRLARELGPGAAVFLPAPADELRWSAAELSLAYTRDFEGLRIVSELPQSAAWSLVLLDLRSTSRAELLFWEQFGPVAALDEGGPARSSVPFLIDVLPRADARERRGSVWLGANEASLAFLDLPLRRRAAAPSAFRRVLLSFGGEDPARLGPALARELLSRGLVEPGHLTLVGGALSAARREGKGASSAASSLEGAILLGPVQDLKEHLAAYDLVITAFGLTAFEAAWAGCGVILLNPSEYHRALSLRAGFPEIGVGSPDLGRLERLLAQPQEVLARTKALVPPERRSLAGLLGSLELSGPQRCPRCGSLSRQALWRSERKSYFRCEDCGMLYLSRFASERADPYKKEYFFEEYRRQYGRTYLEDWPVLAVHARKRLELIESIAERSLGKHRGLSMLDVGCAYGPFLAVAKERGQEPYGIDIAEDAARYVREELGIPAEAGSFPEPQVAWRFGGPFDCLSLWYVIEHFEDLDLVLRTAAALVRPGGILAFSTPSGGGISARRDMKAFLAHSPEDHFTIWEPSRVRGILRAYGFRVQKIRITGHHPERFPWLDKWLAGKGIGQGILRWLGTALSRALRLGDTFEVYAIREPASAPGKPSSAGPEAHAGQAGEASVPGEGHAQRGSGTRANSGPS